MKNHETALGTYGDDEASEDDQIVSATVIGGICALRNVTAHEARIHWNMNKTDAVDLLSVASLIHRRLNSAHMPPRR